jgi:hypothetical protein
MPAPKHKHDEFIRLAIAHAEPGATVEEIYGQLEQTLRSFGIPDEEFPSESTVSRRRRGIDAKELQELQVVKWPESFGSPGLPWEAAQAYFELLREYNRRASIEAAGGETTSVEIFDNRQPLIAVTRWAWRLSIAAPTAPARERWSLAIKMATAEMLTPREMAKTARAVETYLTWGLWGKQGENETQRDARREAYRRFVPPDEQLDNGTHMFPISSFESLAVSSALLHGVPPAGLRGPDFFREDGPSDVNS